VIPAEIISVNTADSLGGNVATGFCSYTYSHHKVKQKIEEIRN
jgi:hypothetical protein